MKNNNVMIKQAMEMVEMSEVCPDALVKSIARKFSRDPSFVQYLFNYFGGTVASELATNMISFHKKNVF